MVKDFLSQGMEVEFQLIKEKQQAQVNKSSERKRRFAGDLKIIVPPPEADDPLDEGAQAQALGITCESQQQKAVYFREQIAVEEEKE